MRAVSARQGLPCFAMIDVILLMRARAGGVVLMPGRLPPHPSPQASAERTA